MRLHQDTTILYPTHHDKPISVDYTYVATTIQQPIVIFCHGYKGFKDWGAWNLVAEAFANAGFFFVKFNFSHNGGTLQQPIDFPDLEAFGHNNYMKEVEDLHCVLDWVTSTKQVATVTLDLHHITVIGHSRGGGIASIVASETDRIHRLVTWAGVSDYKSRFPSGTAFTQWKMDGVYYIANGRTKQQMPHYFQYYTSFMADEDRLTIQKAIRRIKIPHLIIHGTKDTSVAMQNAKDMHAWNPNSILLPIAEANHVFGVAHPWTQASMPNHLSIVVEETIQFINSR